MSERAGPAGGLDEERDFLLRSLEDLEREHAAGDVDDVDYAALKDSYTARTAAVLRTLGGGVPAASTHGATVPRTDAAARRAARQRVWTTVLACVLVAGGASYAVVRFVAPRPVGGTATGGGPESASSLLIQARRTQATDKAAAIALYRKVLASDPDNPEARTYLGWLVANDLLQRGVTAADASAVVIAAMESSETQLDRAIALDPGYADPKCFKGIVRFRFFADAAGAKSAVDACLASNPPEVVKGLVQQLQADVNAALAGG